MRGRLGRGPWTRHRGPVTHVGDFDAPLLDWRLETWPGGWRFRLADAGKAES